MKKTALAGTALAVVAYTVGYKSRDFIRDNFYLPLRSSISQAQLKALYKQALCPKDGIALATFGQSNSANSVSPVATGVTPKNLFQYDWKTGKCYEYKEPLLGTNGTEGNVITYTAIKIAKDTSKPVIVIPFGVGGTSVLEWAYGYLSYQQEIALSNIKKSGLSPKIFLWHQGENDARVEGLSPDDLKEVSSFSKPEGKDFQLGLSRKSYANALQKVVDKTKQYFPDSHFGIALVSKCSNRNQWEPIREAQREIANNNENTFVSADSDKIYNEETRYDKCHFSKEGAQELANQYYSSVSTLLK